MSERLSINEVAEIIGESPWVIRNKCRFEAYDTPICRIQKKKGGKQNRYVFYKDMVLRYVGKK